MWLVYPAAPLLVATVPSVGFLESSRNTTGTTEDFTAPPNAWELSGAPTHSWLAKYLNETLWQGDGSH